MRNGMRNPIPAVAAIILRDREVLLVKRGAEPALGKWSVPGGSVEIGETLEEALKREVREETGLEIQVGTLAGVCDLIVRREVEIRFHYVLIDYFATVVSGEPVAATDVSECRWVPLDQIGRYDVTASLLDRLRERGLIGP
jgi:8-oxo-dGTP diphosphatase